MGGRSNASNANNNNNSNQDFDVEEAVKAAMDAIPEEHRGAALREARRRHVASLTWWEYSKDLAVTYGPAFVAGIFAALAASFGANWMRQEGYIGDAAADVVDAELHVVHG